jgi:hypothetical protein
MEGRPVGPCRRACRMSAHVRDVAQLSDYMVQSPQEQGRSCLCNGAPKCRHEHRLKQHPSWKVEQITPSTLRWTTPSGRQYTTEPTRYPI